MADFTIKRNDTRPAIRVTLSTAPTDVITSVTFKMADKAGTSIVSAAGTIVSQPSATAGGVVEYAWLAADTDQAGRMRGEMQVTFDDARVETYPNKGFIDIEITEDIS